MPWFSPGEGLGKEPVPAAEDIELPAPEPGQAAFQPPLRVEPPQDDAVPGDQSQQLGQLGQQENVGCAPAGIT